MWWWRHWRQRAGDGGMGWGHWRGVGAIDGGMGDAGAGGEIAGILIEA